MRSVLRKTAAVCATGLSILALSACGDDDDPNKKTDTGTEGFRKFSLMIDADHSINCLDTDSDGKALDCDWADFHTRYPDGLGYEGYNSKPTKIPDSSYSLYSVEYEPNQYV